MILNKEFNYKFFILLIFISPFILYSSYLIFLLLICLISILYCNKKIRFNNSMNLYWIIPLSILIFGYKDITAIATAIKIFLTLMIINQLTISQDNFTTLNKYIKNISIVLSISIFIEKIMPSFFITIMNPIFNFMIGQSGTSMIYNNAINGICYGFIPDAATSAGILVFSIGIMLGKNKYEIKDYLLLFCLFLALLFTSKRSHLIFSLISFVFIDLINKRGINKKIKNFLLILILGILFILLIYIFFPYMNSTNGLGRIINTFINFDLQDNTLTSGRSDLVTMAMELFQTHKLLGIGWGEFREVYKLLTFKEILNVHNVYVQLLCEMGIVGTCIMLLPFFKTIFNLRKKIDIKVKMIVSYVLLFNLLYMITGCFFDMPLYYMLFFLYISYIQ